MFLRGIANQVSNTVNPNMLVTVLRSTGYTIASGSLKQIPQYATGVSGPAQIQALDSTELKKVDGLNLQGVKRALYLTGSLKGVIRAGGTGADLVTIAAPAPAQYIGTWLVAMVLETWQDWTKVAIVQQVTS